MRWSRIVPMFLALALAAVVAAPRAVAQEATPIAGDVPAPEECTVEPRSLESLLAILGTPVADPSASVDASPTPFAMPAGEPVDEATATEVRATIRQLVACINAGDYLRALAVYSDDFVRGLFAGFDPAELTPDVLAAQATPSPLSPEARLSIIEFREMVVLADGRVAALVVGDDPTNETPAGPALFTLIRSGDRWQVDEVVSSTDIAESLGTPTPE